MSPAMVGPSRTWAESRRPVSESPAVAERLPGTPRFTGSSWFEALPGPTVLTSELPHRAIVDRFLAGPHVMQVC